MIERRWYALLVETESYAPGPQYLNWTLELQPELDRKDGRHPKGISYVLAQKCSSRREAEAYIAANAHLIERHDGSERQRKARAQGGRCWYCGRVLNLDTVGEDDSAELEHQTPRSRGLEVCNTDANKVTSCRECNNPAGDGKGDRTLEEYRAHLLARRHPGKAHLFFYGEWLRFVDLWRGGFLDRAALGRIAFQSLLHPARALGFPRELLLKVFEGDLTIKAS